MVTQHPFKRQGLVYTFYSFKGGVGRSMALANIAIILARWQKRVLVIDWDLEAPGIERYFADHVPDGRSRRETPGLVELVAEVGRGGKPRWRDHLIHAVIPDGVTIDVITAGCDNQDYVQRLREIDWSALFVDHGLGSFLEEMRTEWIGEYDFVLVDSRTGITDIGSICTIHLPDVIVTLFTANHQNLHGVKDVMQRARHGHQLLPIERNRLLVLPVPARDESDREYKLAEEWRARFAHELKEFFDDWAPRTQKTENILNLLKVPYFSYWSFGERLPVLEEDPQNPKTLAGAFAFLAKLIMTGLDWDQAVRGTSMVDTAVRQFAAIEQHRSGVLESDRRERTRTSEVKILTQDPELPAAAAVAPLRADTGFRSRKFTLNFAGERHRHERFVGRVALLARLDQLLVADSVDRWVLVTGGPGMGKSALLAAWLARREMAGTVVPHHFIRRGMYDWDDPAKLVGSLVAQIEAGFPTLGESDIDERMHPAARLARMLLRVSEQKLGPRGERLIILIDGLDEYDPSAETATGDPLAAFLPDALPAGVRLLCASRPRHPYLSSLQARDGELVQIDLDDPSNVADNDATVRAFWAAAAEPLGLDTGFVDEAVARAGGNVQHAVQLRKHLAVLPPERRRVEDIPRGLAALIEKSWERIAVDAVVVEGLGILCAAHEALALDELGTVAGWTGDAQRRAFTRAAKELLVETSRPGGQPEYRLHHDSIRGHIARAIGDVALRAHHRALAQLHATWPAPGGGIARRYALRHALIHRAEAGDWADAWQLASDMSFLEAKCRELGEYETEADVARVAERCRASDDGVIAGRFGDLVRALARESHRLRAAPEATAALVWNRLRRSGWSANDLDGLLRVPASAGFLRVRHAATRESPALVRDLVGHSGIVTACSVTADGRRVVSASHDRTLKVWDLSSGRALATLDGHTGAVNACAVAADGRRMISASEDRTLKVWDLDSGHVLVTLGDHTDWVTACAVTADGRRVISASHDRTLKIWDLDSGRVLATLEGHTGAVNACAVTPDGRYVVSASKDQTLRVFDLDNGYALVTLKGHTGAVNACAVTADGRRVISASEDRTLKVWDLDSGNTLATLEGHSGGLTACAATADDRLFQLGLCGPDGRVMSRASLGESPADRGSFSVDGVRRDGC